MWLQKDDQDDDDQNDQQKTATDVHFLRLLRLVPRTGASILDRLVGCRIHFSGREDESEVLRLAAATAERTWWNADWYIAAYVADAAPRLAAECHGIPPFFFETGADDDLALACYRYSLGVLGEMARSRAADEDDAAGNEWVDALAEAVHLGMLWD